MAEIKRELELLEQDKRDMEQHEKAEQEKAKAAKGGIAQNGTMKQLNNTYREIHSKQQSPNRVISWYLTSKLDRV